MVSNVRQGTLLNIDDANETAQHLKRHSRLGEDTTYEYCVGFGAMIRESALQHWLGH